MIESLEVWLREKLGLLSRKSNLAEAIRYALSRWAVSGDTANWFFRRFGAERLVKR